MKRGGGDSLTTQKGGAEPRISPTNRAVRCSSATFYPPCLNNSKCSAVVWRTRGTLSSTKERVRSRRWKEHTILPYGEQLFFLHDNTDLETGRSPYEEIYDFPLDLGAPCHYGVTARSACSFPFPPYRLHRNSRRRTWFGVKRVCVSRLNSTFEFSNVTLTFLPKPATLRRVAR